MVSERVQVRPCVVPEVTFNDHLIVLPIAGQLNTNFCPDGFTTKRHTCRAGDIGIYPAGTSTQCTIETHHDYRYNCLQLKTDAVNKAVSEVIDISNFELDPKFGLADPLVKHILYQIGSVTDDKASLDRLYVDSLANTLFVHLLQNHATCKKAIPQYAEGLSQYQLRRAIDYIQTHLEQDIKLADIVDLLGMSQYYFARLFRQSMGVAPYQYVIQQRVERAKRLLRQPPKMSLLRPPESPQARPNQQR